ncbi:MAG: PEP-CTERM sorting domain-containing protein [Phycisphaerae bacterium]|nr:PEP-CTERM sorting domain-containing protein [Phycisphaerae bacterium]
MNTTLRTRMATALAVGWLALFGGQANADLVLDLQASSYNQAGATWVNLANTGNNATSSGAYIPALVAGATGNGSSVVRFDGIDDALTMATALTNTNGAYFTVVAYAKYTYMTSGHLGTLISGNAYTAGNAGQSDLQYRISQSAGTQMVVAMGVAGYAQSSSGSSSTSFHTFGVTARDAGSAYYLDGNAAGTVSGTAFMERLTTIGARWPGETAAGEGLNGDIAEIRVYTGQLSLSEIAAINTEFAKIYSGATPALSESLPNGSTLSGQTNQNVPGSLSGVTLSNTGASGSYLAIQSYAIGGADAAKFSLPGWAAADVLNGTGQTYTPQFSGVGTPGQTYTGTLTFYTTRGSVTYNLAGTVVPEPATMAFLALGGLAMIGSAIRRRRKA